ncbi:MAG: hypothetical protein RML38_00900 [Bacteroidia bacterium]|nr:hypothetical protein [Bacteroidia bacterium]
MLTQGSEYSARSSQHAALVGISTAKHLQGYAKKIHSAKIY